MPIAVFDSGVGGLTVLTALKKRWPTQDFIYLADTARLPYGSKSLHTIRQYVEQNIRFLTSEFKPRAVVIACNSASTAILESPVAASVPVFNVVEPGARKAVESTKSQRIGVLGTRATVFSEAYPKAIRKLNPSVEVFQQPCPLWVPLVEEGWIDDPVTNLIVFRYANAIAQKKIDTLILGCTHYPYLKPVLAKALGPKVRLIDSAEETAIETTRILATEGLRANPGVKGRLEFYASDAPERFARLARRMLGRTVTKVHLHPFDV
jgi:glutamate racemase